MTSRELEQMVSYFVRYDGRSADPDGFLRHYRTEHAHLLHRFDGIQGLTLHTPVDWTDPYPVQKGSLSLLAQMTFDSIEALNRGLVSDARRIARKDFENFPDFGGKIYHQALKAEKIF